VFAASGGECVATTGDGWRIYVRCADSERVSVAEKYRGGECFEERGNDRECELNQLGLAFYNKLCLRKICCVF
jgi:hypothetical protein